MSMVGWLQFNVPFQHKYGYRPIRDETYVHNYVNIVSVDYLLSCLVKLVKIYSCFFNTTSYSDIGE